MRQFLFSVLLLGSASVVQAINDFETVFKVYKKGVDEEVKWKDFSGTDMKSMTLVATKPGSNVRIPLPRKFSPPFISASPSNKSQKSVIVPNQAKAQQHAHAGSTMESINSKMGTNFPS